MMFFRPLEERARQAAPVQASCRSETVQRRGQTDLLEQAKQDLHLQVKCHCQESPLKSVLYIVDKQKIPLV